MNNTSETTTITEEINLLRSAETASVTVENVDETRGISKDYSGAFAKWDDADLIRKAIEDMPEAKGIEQIVIHRRQLTEYTFA